MNTMNHIEHAADTSFRNRFKKPPVYRPKSDQLRFAIETNVKYDHYEKIGHAIFAVTLSTFLSSEKIARSEWTGKFWEHDFLYRIKKHLPLALREKIDHDYVMERSDAGHWHYHGLLAMPKEAADMIYKDGQVKRQLDRDLKALNKPSPYRKFAVNSFLIEPIRPDLTIGNWISYLIKTHDYIVSTH